MTSIKKEDKDALKVTANWSEWANYVLIELKRLNASIQNLETQVGEIKLELAQLKVKSGIWGAAAAVLTFISFLGVNYLKNTMEQKSVPQTPPAYYQYYPYPNSSPTAPSSSSSTNPTTHSTAPVATQPSPAAHPTTPPPSQPTTGTVP